jgi:hypothetical protein
MNKKIMNVSVQHILLLLVAVTFVLGCKSKNKIESKENTSNELIYPIMPIQQQSYLFENVELIDYIFQDLPFSLSQSEKPSIQSKIAGIAQEGVTQSDCTPMARMFFQYKGEIIIEADVFFSPPDCQHYIFYEDGKPIYANKMAPQNIQFYSQFLNNMNVSQ